MPFPKPGGGSGITQLTGDAAAGPGSGSQPLTLASVVGAGTVGDTTHYPIVTFDAKGRVTGASAQAAPGAANGIGVITGDLTTPAASTPAQSVAGTLASVGTAGTYGSASLIPVITTDAKGRVTAVSTVAPTAAPLTYQSLTGLSGGVDVVLTANIITPVSTITLPVGIWLINATVLVVSRASPAAGDAAIGSVTLGTATATFSGATIPYFENSILGTSPWYQDSIYDFIANVTVAGTIIINMRYTATGNGTAVNSNSGYTAIKVA
jgi:hypothetical protein